MRLLIAGGGTGGHIYPALAVARSLRARPDAAELAWLGGHRGLEATLVPPAGIPLRRLLAALAPVGRRATSTSCSTRSGSACRSRRRSSCCSRAARRRSSRPAATSRSRRCSPRRCSGSRACCGRATWSRAAACASSRARATVLAVSYAGDGGGARAPRARTSPGRRSGRSAGVDPDEARERVRRPARASGSCWCSAARRPSGGSTTR